MLSDQQLKVGDVIFDFGTAFRITKVSVRTGADGETAYINYEPFFVKKRGNQLSYSAPVNLLSKTKKRRPLSKQDLRQVLSLLSQTDNTSTDINYDAAQKVLNSNDPIQVAELIAQLSFEANEGDKTLPWRKKELLKEAIGQLSEEVAVIESISLSEAVDQINNLLH